MSYNTWILEKETADYIYLALKEQDARMDGWSNPIITQRLVKKQKWMGITNMLYINDYMLNEESEYSLRLLLLSLVGIITYTVLQRSDRGRLNRSEITLK